MKRYLTSHIEDDLKKKMVFIGGPRQVGKTTLSFQFLDTKNELSNFYYNWDSGNDRKRIISEKLPSSSGIVVLDEIHKYKSWRNLVKGLYDKYKSSFSFLITGSARLDYYRRSGDSLQGRYHYYRLHPLSIGELKDTKHYNLKNLIEFGGFPEPFLLSNKKDWRRWQNERLSRIIHEDVTSLEKIREISSLKLLADLLPEKVGSPLSINSLATDLNVSHATTKNWIQILSNLYFCFLIPPYGHKKIRAVKKEQKLYLWDWSLCKNESEADKGTQFENLVASHLLKYCHFIEDTQGHKMELKYLRDTDKREVDFVITKDGTAEFAVECKLKPKNISRNIYYFKERTQIKQFFQVHLTGESYQKDDILCLNIEDFVEYLNLP